MSKIPPGAVVSVNTRNTWEAAFLYALGDVQPSLNPDGTCGAFCQREADGSTVVWFRFDSTPRAHQIHSAFLDKSYEDGVEHVIPEEVMPAVIALMKRTRHNWERLKDATKSLPVHIVKQEGSTIKIVAVKS